MKGALGDNPTTVFSVSSEICSDQLKDLKCRKAHFLQDVSLRTLIQS